MVLLTHNQQNSNIPSIQFVANQVVQKRIKHIKLDWHVAQEKLQAGIITTFFILFEHQFADIFIKAFSKGQFYTMVSELSIFVPYILAWGFQFYICAFYNYIFFFIPLLSNLLNHIFLIYFYNHYDLFSYLYTLR